MRLLLIEDDALLGASLKKALGYAGYSVEWVRDGADGAEAAISGDFDILIIDVNLPHLSGFDIIQQVKKSNASIQPYMIMVTARDSLQDKIRGLDSGADDYLAKPFSFEVLLARVRALIRRPRTALPELLTAGNLSLDPATKIVKRSGQNIKLSAKEYAILEYLMRNKGQILSKNNIMSHVWDFDSDILPNNIEVFITYLRAKIDKPFNEPPLIQTVRGFGYILAEE